MVVADYFKTIEQLLSNSKFIVDKAVDFKEFSSNEGMVRGRLLLTQEKVEFVAAQDFCDWLPRFHKALEKIAEILISSF